MQELVIIRQKMGAPPTQGGFAQIGWDLCLYGIILFRKTSYS